MITSIRGNIFDERLYKSHSCAVTTVQSRYRLPSVCVLYSPLGRARLSPVPVFVEGEEKMFFEVNRNTASPSQTLWRCPVMATCLTRRAALSFVAPVQTHQARRHPGVSAAEPGLVAEVLTQRETTHAARHTLCEGEHTDITRVSLTRWFFTQLQSVGMNFKTER